MSEFIIPTRKGYTFAGWEINGSEVPGSLQITEPETLTAEWTKNASTSSSRTNSADTNQRASSSKTDSVDTNQQQVEAAASEADQATNDPGTLSSQDWNAVLNTSSGSASSAVSSAVSSQVSSAASGAGGFSTLFLVGVILVVVGVAGVGTFIYLQFIRGKGGKGGKGGPHGPSGPDKATDDTIVFTDINSYSDGKKHNSELFGAVRQPVSNGPTKKAAAHPEQPAQPTASVKRQAEEPTQYLERSEAKAVPGNKSDFDWEKFFNEESRGE